MSRVKRSDVWYFISTTLFFCSLAATIIFTCLSYSNKEHLTSYGNITQIYCDVCEDCVEKITIFIKYQIHDLEVIGSFTTTTYPGCIYPKHITYTQQCCDNLYGDQIWMEFNDKDFITRVSEHNTYISPIYITMSVLFFVSSFIIFCMCIIMPSCKGTVCHRYIFHHEYYIADDLSS